MKKTWIAFAAGVGLLLSACSSASTTDQSSSDAGSSTSASGDTASSSTQATTGQSSGAQSSQSLGTSETTQSSAGAASLDEIRALLPERFSPGSKIRVGVRDDSPPNELLDKDGNLVGYEIELMAEVAKALDLEIDYMITPFNTLIPSLQADRVDIAFGALGTNPERQKVAQFVSWVGSQGSFIGLTANKIRIETMDQLCGMSMSSTLGGQTTTFAEEYSAQCEAKGLKPIDIQTFKSTNEDLLAVKSGRAQIWYGSGVNVGYIAATSNGELEVVGTDDHDAVPLGITILKDSDVIPAIHAAVNYVVQSPAYEPILAKWGVSGAAISESLLYPLN